jgi:hypothetical protein
MSSVFLFAQFTVLEALFLMSFAIFPAPVAIELAVFFAASVALFHADLKESPQDMFI